MLLSISSSLVTFHWNGTQKINHCNEYSKIYNVFTCWRQLLIIRKTFFTCSCWTSSTSGLTAPPGTGALAISWLANSYFDEKVKFNQHFRFQVKPSFKLHLKSYKVYPLLSQMLIIIYCLTNYNCKKIWRNCTMSSFQRE